MTDKELLELAAKAAGIDLNSDSWMLWNPLWCDSDALMLAVKLRMAIEYDSEYLDQPAKNVYVQAQGYDAFEPLCYDPYAATRRAIVRAAAEIGGTMG